MKDQMFDLCVAVSLKVQSLRRKAKKLVTNEDGSAMVEYALVLGLVVAGMVGAFTFFFPQIKTFMGDIIKKITDMLV